MKAIRVAAVLVLVAAAGALLFVSLSTEPAPATLVDYFRENGVREIGAINLVSAIYLGYRIYDTLGETIVLMLAVAGVVMVLERPK